MHSYPLLQSVNVTPSCTPARRHAAVVTLAWSEYTATDSDHPDDDHGVLRRRAAGESLDAHSGPVHRLHVDSTFAVTHSLNAMPTVSCPGAVDGCTGAGSNVPTVVTMTLTSNDPDGHGTTSYTATLPGERRQT